MKLQATEAVLQTYDLPKMIQLKKAELSDSEAINLLVNSAYRGDASKKGWTTEADLLGGQRTDVEKIREMISEENARIELAVENGEIIGCMYIKKEEATVYFGMLAVKPTLQNNGLGKLLLGRGEELTQEWGLKKIRMNVISHRPELNQYYERQGYFSTGKTEPFPENDPRFGIPKTKLVFNEYIKLF